MASIKEINRKAEQLIEQGNKAQQAVKACQSRVAALSSEVMAARVELAQASQTDEEGNTVGDVGAAQARLNMIENQLEAGRRALEQAKTEVERINSQKEAQVQEISRHNEVSKANLDKLSKLSSMAFSENSEALSAGIAERLNEAEDARVALLRSMGKEVSPSYVRVGREGTSSASWDGGGVASSFDHEQTGNGKGVGSFTTPIAAAAAGSSIGATFMNGQPTKVDGGISKEASAFDKLSAYMRDHNYGIDDYDTYSKDPEWQKLHAAVYPDYHQVANHELPRDEKIDWIISNVPCESRADAETIVDSMEWYSVNGYDEIHWDEDCKLPDTHNILRAFDSSSIKPYKGVIYRGLSFKSKKDLMKALLNDDGVWNEPGITSFSASEEIAEEFASQKEWGLIFTCTDNKSAIPFRHISRLSREDEVLSPGKHRNSGWDIDMDSIRVDNERRFVYANIYEK